MTQLKTRERPARQARRDETRQSRGEDTRQRLIAAAFEVFAERGYEGATTRHLAERAGVNLPAIQYYFGNKEGLYRAAVGTIVARIEEHMAEVARRIEAALTARQVPKKRLIGLLLELLDAFVILLAGKDRSESGRLFIARAEIEFTEALDPFHKIIQRRIVGPATELVARLIGRPAKDERTVLKAVAILGEVNIFCQGGARRTLGWASFDDAQVAKVKNMLREHVPAIFNAANGARS
ncbi:MAG TPA: CerR family C-terminal domain-containing protein [Alphaproteobacteria bacterium]|nr:CerR family C-terminal domain-containing protein [Alphaproteobacteria bacterium]